MNFTDKHIVETYSELLEGLSFDNKIELIENLSKSLSAKEKDKEKDFYKSFGAFASSMSPEEIIKEIRSGRKFRQKYIRF